MHSYLLEAALAQDDADNAAHLLREFGSFARFYDHLAAETYLRIHGNLIPKSVVYTVEVRGDLETDWHVLCGVPATALGLDPEVMHAKEKAWQARAPKDPGALFDLWRDEA